MHRNVKIIPHDFLESSGLYQTRTRCYSWVKQNGLAKVDCRLYNRILPKATLIEKKSLFQKTMWLVSFANKQPLNQHWVLNDTKTDEWLKGLFQLSITSWLWTLLMIHYCWILTTFKVLFSYLTLLYICHGKDVKIIFQNLFTHLKSQIDVSRCNFGMDGFPYNLRYFFNVHTKQVIV